MQNVQVCFYVLYWCTNYSEKSTSPKKKKKKKKKTIKKKKKKKKASEYAGLFIVTLNLHSDIAWYIKWSNSTEVNDGK